MKLSSTVPTSSLSATSPIACKSLVTLTATRKLESRMTINSKSDAASSSLGRLQDAHLGGLMDKARGNLSLQKRNQDVDISESETCNVQEEAVLARPIANKTAVEKPHASSIQTARKVQKLNEKYGHTIYTYLQPQLTIRKQSSRSSGKSMDEDMTTLWMIWT